MFNICGHKQVFWTISLITKRQRGGVPPSCQLMHCFPTFVFSKVQESKAGAPGSRSFFGIFRLFNMGYFIISGTSHLLFHHISFTLIKLLLNPRDINQVWFLSLKFIIFTVVQHQEGFCLLWINKVWLLWCVILNPKPQLSPSNLIWMNILTPSLERLSIRLFLRTYLKESLFLIELLPKMKFKASLMEYCPYGITLPVHVLVWRNQRLWGW